MSTWPWWLLKPCGTEAAARRHQRHGEKPDPACLQAAAAAQQQRRRERKARAARTREAARQ